MGFVVGQADNYKHLLNRLRMYAKGWAHPGRPTFVGTGNGGMTAVLATASTVAETWTITFTDATNFTVTGSVSGAMAGGTVGTPYSNTYLSFLITAGGTAFVAADAFTIVVTAALPSGDRWTEDRYTTSTEDELVMHGPGSGADAIYVGIQTESNVTGDWYNWRLQGYTGFSAGASFHTQAGAIPSKAPMVCLWQNAMSYWFVVSGRRMLVVAKVSTVYEACYLGFLQPYASPGQYPYPNCIAGTRGFNGAEPAVTSALYRWSDTSADHRMPWEPITSISSIGSFTDDATQTRLRLASGTWRGFTCGVSGGYSINSFAQGGPGNGGASPSVLTQSGPTIWPGCGKTTSFNVQQALDGSVVLVPVVFLTGDASPNDGIAALGEMDGVFAISGQGVAVEDKASIGGTDYLILPNIFRTNRYDFYAVKLA